MTKMRKSRKTFWTLAASGCLLAVGFVYGVLVGKREYFPYRQLVFVKRWVIPQDSTDQKQAPNSVTINTSHARLELLSFESTTPSGFTGGGGGLAVVDEVVIGVDGAGKFFSYRGSGEIRMLELGLELNTAHFIQYLYTNVAPSLLRDRMQQGVRVMGLAVREKDERHEVLVCYFAWNPDEFSKTFRISRLRVRDFDSVIEGRLSFGPDDWEVVFENLPALKFDSAVPAPFGTRRTGGRIVLGEHGEIFVTTADQRFDGFLNSWMASQDETSLLGKILRIDPESGDVEIHARGMRNPQGLAFDRHGNLWSTSHGPEGGDELNRIVEGENYGWPLVTYGTDYFSFSWPLAQRQGRHDGFTKPVYAWVPSVGVSNLLEVRDNPGVWDGDLLVGSLSAGSLFRMRIVDERIVFSEPIPIGHRIRDLVQMSDGTFLLLIDSGFLMELRDITARGMGFPVPITDSDNARGLEHVLKRCASCHALGPNSITVGAPSLWGVTGREIGSSPSYSGYSKALKSRAGDWDADTLKAYLSDPQGFAPGTKMALVPMSAETLDAVIRYLHRLH